MPIPFADPAYILRAANKDTYYVSSLSQQVTDLCAAIMGMRFTTNHGELLAAASNVLYMLCTFMAGKQTIGEEYTDLLPITPAARPVGMYRRLLFLAFFAAEPFAMKALASSYFPTRSAKEVADHIKNMHNAVFFLFGAYATLPHRLARVRLGALTPPRNNGSDSSSYPLLGLLLTIQYVTMFAMYLRTRRRERQQAATSPREGQPLGTLQQEDTRRTQRSAATASDSDENGEDIAVSGKCMLCLGGRKVPTATLCGHIFCWSCILDWCNANHPSALCPLCRQTITPQSLVRLVQYKQPAK